MIALFLIPLEHADVAGNFLQLNTLQKVALGYSDFCLSCLFDWSSFGLTQIECGLMRY